MWHAAGAFKKFGYSVVERLVRRRRGVRAPCRHPRQLQPRAGVVDVGGPVLRRGVRPAGRAVRVALRAPAHRPVRGPEAARARAGAAAGDLRAPGRAADRAYAPTFRGNTVGKARYDDLLDLRALHDGLGDGYAVLLKLHPFVRTALEIPPGLDAFAIDASADPDLNELMLVADVLVTDYSSAIYEFALLGRPIAFLAPDVEAYGGERGFYLDFPGDLPGPVFATTAELAAAIRADDFDLERVRAFATASFDVVDGRATARIVGELLLPALRGEPPAR